jgi:hypothetical protein
MNLPSSSPTPEYITFCDKNAEQHEIPARIADILLSAGSIHTYLYQLSSVAGVQQQQSQRITPQIYGNIEVISPFPPGEDESEIGDINALLNNFALTRTSVQGNTVVQQARTEIADRISPDDMQALDQWLGIESVKLEAGDVSALMGVNMENVRIAFYYVTEYLPSRQA